MKRLHVFKPPGYTYYIDLDESLERGVEKPVFAKWAGWMVKKAKKDEARLRELGKEVSKWRKR